MASTVSREKLIFYSVAGGLGGLAAWGAAEPFMGIRNVYVRALILGAFIGAFIGAFLASIDALSVGQRRLALRGMRAGGLIGALGGARGRFVAELGFDLLEGRLIGRIVGWAVLGVVIGFGTGWASRSQARMRNGALGGVLGGALGGFLYQLLTTLLPQILAYPLAFVLAAGGGPPGGAAPAQSAGSSSTDVMNVAQMLGLAIAITVLGVLIGFFIGLVSELLKQGWLMVVRSKSRNAREGREYSLLKQVTSIGRAEECDVGLFGDQSVAPRHAVIRREGRNFYLTPSSGARVIVNRALLNGRHLLRSGDRIEIGGTLFLFRERVQSSAR
jgi:hypothetical protein